MFHVKPDEHEPEPAAALDIFGDRISLARQYREVLATDGIVRGLIGPREVQRLWDRHILNCAVVAGLIPQSAHVVDIGSGAGLPGIPLAIARPDLHITLVEPLLRRTRFLDDVLNRLELDVTVTRGRAEDKAIIRTAGNADVVTSRAVAPLAKLAGWSMPLLRREGIMLALKGASAAEELSRDRAALVKAGADQSGIVECGAEWLTPPVTVVRARRKPGAGGSSSRLI